MYLFFLYVSTSNTKNYDYLEKDNYKKALYCIFFQYNLLLIIFLWEIHRTDLRSFLTKEIGVVCVIFRTVIYKPRIEVLSKNISDISWNPPRWMHSLEGWGSNFHRILEMTFFYVGYASWWLFNQTSTCITGDFNNCSRKEDSFDIWTFGCPTCQQIRWLGYWTFWAYWERWQALRTWFNW